MATFTVFGLVELDRQELIVAAVVAGEVDAIDENAYGGDLMRYADTFEAETPEEAEQLAVAAVAEGSE
jgi:hypothetical protein